MYIQQENRFVLFQPSKTHNTDTPIMRLFIYMFRISLFVPQLLTLVQANLYGE